MLKKALVVSLTLLVPHLLLPPRSSLLPPPSPYKFLYKFFVNFYEFYFLYLFNIILQIVFQNGRLVPYLLAICWNHLINCLLSNINFVLQSLNRAKVVILFFVCFRLHLIPCRVASAWKNLEKPGICNRYLENLENREEKPKTWKNLEYLKLFLEKRQFIKCCFFSFILATF